MTCIGKARLARAERTIDELRALDGDQRTPVLVAASGARARALAAAKADIVTRGSGPTTSRADIGEKVAGIRASAGDRGAGIEFMQPIFVIGEQAPPWALRFLQTDTATLIEHDSPLILRGSPREMAGELRRRREALGFSYFSVNGAYIEDFAPVVELLAGQ